LVDGPHRPLTSPLAVPADADSPAQRAAQQVADTGFAVGGGGDEEGGKASPRMAPMALNRRGGAPRNRTGVQLAQR
jgi:hypothetical protein